MYHGTVQPNTTNGTAESFRDVGPDKWGFKFRQYANGMIIIIQAPVQGVMGGWLVGTTGGYLENSTLRPGEPMWAKVTQQIGEHPYQHTLKHGTGPRPTALAGWGAAPWVQTFTDITSGFTATPTGDAGEVTSQVVDAVPGIHATIAQLVTPSTLHGMSKRLGKLKGQHAATYDPVKKAMLAEQISALEFQIGQVKNNMTATTTAPESLGAYPWWPFAAAGALLLVIGAVTASNRKGVRR